MKRIIILLGILSLIIAGLFSAQYLINWESYKKDIIASMASATGRDVAINGRITGALLPLPYIKASDVRIANAPEASEEFIVEAGSLKGRFGLLALLQGKVEITKITLEKSIVYLEVLENGEGNWNFSFRNNPASDKLPPSFDTIHLINSEVVLRKNSSQFLQTLNKTNAVIDFSSAKEPFDVEGYFSEGEEKIAFNFHLDKTRKDHDTAFLGEILLGEDKFSFAGNMTEKSNHMALQGKITATVQDVRRYAEMSPEKLAALMLDKEQQPLTATANLSFSGKEVRLEDISLNASNIKGNGHVKVYFDTTPVVDAILNFDMINLDGLQKTIKNTKGQEVKFASYERQARKKYGSFILPTNINALLYTTVKKLTYKGQDIENAAINADLFNGEIELYPSTAELPDGGKLEMSGNISSNTVRSAFEGEITTSGKDLISTLGWLGYTPPLLPVKKTAKFDIKTQINITPKEIRLSAMDVVIDNLTVSGFFNIRHGSGMPEINANFVVNSLNLDNPVLFAKLEEVVQPFTGKSDREIGAEFQWLRTFPSKFAAEISVGELQYNQRRFTRPLVVFHVMPGLLKCDKLAIDSEFASLEAEASLDIRALRPKVMLQLKGKKLDAVIFSKPEEQQNKDVLPPPLVSDIQVPPPAAVPVVKAKWSNKEFDFLRLDKFSGDIRVVLDSFTYQNMPIENVNLVSHLEDGVVVIDNFKGDAFKGKLLAKGGIGITPPSISMSFSLSNGKIELLLPVISSRNTMAGYFSMSGSFTVQGNSPALWASSLDAGIAVAARDMTINNFDLHKIVETADGPNSFTEAGFVSMANEAAKKGSTVFNSVDGKITASQGIVQINGLTFNTVRTSGIMSGGIDVKNWVLNIASKVAFIPKVGEQPLTFGLALTGKVESPDKKLDIAGLQAYVMSQSTQAPVPVQVQAPKKDDDGWGTTAPVDQGVQPQ